VQEDAIIRVSPQINEKNIKKDLFRMLQIITDNDEVKMSKKVDFRWGSVYLPGNLSLRDVAWPSVKFIIN